MENHIEHEHSENAYQPHHEEPFHDHESMLLYYKNRTLGDYAKIPGSGEDEKGFFGFIRAVYNYRFYEEDITLAPDSLLSLANRCDAGASRTTPTPTSLHEEDIETGLCSFCGSDKPIYGTTNSHHSSLSNSKNLRMPFHGYKGFICYLELVNSEVEEMEVYESSHMARTLQELFKLMLEWEWVYDNLDSEDICAKLAHDILEELDMPDMLRAWLWENVPDMHVARFLKGHPDARARPDVSEIPPMIPEFEGWCWYNIYQVRPTWPYGTR